MNQTCRQLALMRRVPRNPFTRRQSNGQSLLALVWLVLLPGLAEACSVPVFRYALERWEPNDYGLLLRGPSDAAWRQGASGEMIEAIREERSMANVRLAVEESLSQPRAAGEPSGPRATVELRYPPGTGLREPVWSGSAADDRLPQLLESPMRTEIGRRLLDGDCAVWLLIESGATEADDRAAARLDTRLEQLESELEIQTLDPTDIAAGLVSVTQAELRVRFSLLRLSRTDESESVLLAMLLGTEPDLRDFDEPIAIPVFGRGRALYALVGEGISKGTIDRACAFLVGPCSCQAKELNPGVDLLMAVDWDGGIQRSVIASRELPPLTGLASFGDAPDAAGPEPEPVGHAAPVGAGVADQAEDPSGQSGVETPTGPLRTTDVPLVRETTTRSRFAGLGPMLGGLSALALLGLGVGTWFIWRRNG